jgi:hypothetical protein
LICLLSLIEIGPNIHRYQLKRDEAILFVLCRAGRGHGTEQPSPRNYQMRTRIKSGQQMSESNYPAGEERLREMGRKLGTVCGAIFTMT